MDISRVLNPLSHSSRDLFCSWKFGLLSGLFLNRCRHHGRPSGKHTPWLPLIQEAGRAPTGPPAGGRAGMGAEAHEVGGNEEGRSPWDRAPSWGALPSARPSCPPTGEQIKRVKPKRTTSFFSRQLSLGQGSYTVVQPSDSLEQG